MQGALSGIRVLDMSRLLPGPYCTLVMADHGAEVIKVETPFEGDYIRKMGPMVDEDSAFFWQLNRNKKSISLNLKTREGKEIFEKLVAGADVLVESFRPGVMDSLGLGYARLKEINNRLIYCAITGYGQDGPYRLRAGHDLNYISIAGVLLLSATRDEPPVMPALQLADVGGGSLWGLVAILLALLAREKTGRGQFLDISMTEGSMACLPLQFAQYFMTGEIPRRNEAILSGYLACYNLYRTKDGKYISMGILEPKFWKAFCEAVERPQWIGLQYGPLEVQNELKEKLKALFAERARDEWMEIFGKVADSCVEPLLEPGEVLDHPQIAHRKFFLEVDHPEKGKLIQVGFPCRLSETPAKFYKNPPRLGEDTEELLRELGYSGDEIKKLRKKGVI